MQNRQVKNAVLSENLLKLRNYYRMSQVEFAAYVGVNKDSLSNWETGRSDPGASKLALLFENTEINLNWLLTGEGPMFAKSLREPPDSPGAYTFAENTRGSGVVLDAPAEPNGERTPPPLIPVVGHVTGGPDGGFSHDVPLYHLPAPYGLEDDVPHLFGAEISGESMIPVYRPGDVVICDTRVPVTTDDAALVSLSWGETVCKIWRRLDKDTVRLNSYNPAFNPLDVPARDITFKAKIIGLVWGSLAAKQRG